VRKEAAADGRKLHCEELHDLCSSRDITWVMKTKMRLAGRVALMGERGAAIRGLAGNFKERDHSEHVVIDGLWTLSWEGLDWINRVQDRDSWRGVVNTIMSFRVP
jgi:hypothetical protein